MFTSATRAAIEKIQQQYGLPVNGIWGSLERQVFDNARVRTLPPSSAASLMPPDYNRTTDAVKYQKAVVSQRPAPAASKLSKTFPTATIPTDVSGIVTCAAAGFLTAAVLTKADSARRARLPPSAARARRRGGVVDAAAELWGKLIGGFSVGGASDRSHHHHHASGRGWYDEQGYFHQEPPRGPPGDFGVPDKRAQQQRDFGGAAAASDGRWWDATRADSHDPFPGGYPIPPSDGIDADGGYGAFAARGPVRPGDRRAAERARISDDAAAAAEANAPRGYHPAFAAGGPAHDPDRMPSPPPPPSTPPARGSARTPGRFPPEPRRFRRRRRDGSRPRRRRLPRGDSRRAPERRARSSRRWRRPSRGGHPGPRRIARGGSTHVANHGVCSSVRRLGRVRRRRLRRARAPDPRPCRSLVAPTRREG